MDGVKRLVAAAHLLAGTHLSFEPAADDLFAHIFHTPDKELLQVILLHCLHRFDGLILCNLALQLLDLDLEVPDLVRVVRLEDLDIALRFLLHLRLGHARSEEDVEELAELEVLRRDRALPVPAGHVGAGTHSVRVSSVVLRGEEPILIGVARADALDSCRHEGLFGAVALDGAHVRGLYLKVRKYDCVGRFACALPD